MLLIRGIYPYFYIYRPPTPPYMPFSIRRFRAFSSHDVWQVVFSYPFEYDHFYSIVGFRPIVRIESSFRTSGYKQNRRVAIIYYCTARFSPSPQAHVPQVLWHLLTSHDKFCSMSYVKKTNRHVCETSSDKGIVFPSYIYFIFLLRSRKLHNRSEQL